MNEGGEKTERGGADREGILEKSIYARKRLVGDVRSGPGGGDFLDAHW